MSITPGLGALRASGRLVSCGALAFLIWVLASATVRSDEQGDIEFEHSVLTSPAPCTDSECHGPDNGGTFTAGGPELVLTGLPASYSGGEVLDLTLTNDSGVGSDFGFQIMSVFEDNSQAGSLAPLTAGLRFRQYAPTPFGPIQYLSHIFPLDVTSVNFRWTAPAQASGDVTFKFASNSANGDGDNTFDSIFFNTVTLPAASGPANDPPVAVQDDAVTLEETAVTLNVLANDSDPESDPLSVSGVSDPANGAAVVNGDNTVTYTPDAGFFGLEQFTYTLSDGQGNQVQGQINVQVNAFEPDLVFPQFVNGEAGGNNSSRIVIRNTDDNDNATGFIRFRPTAGPDTVPVDGDDVIRVDFDIAPFGLFEVETDGTGGFQVGVVEVVVTAGDESRVEGTLVFFVLGTFVSVDAAPLRDQHQVFVSVVAVPDPAPNPDNVSETAGVAAYNPDAENTATLRLVLLDEDGIEQAAKTITLGPRTQLVKFINESDADANREFFPDFFAANPAFRGSLNITVTSGPDIAVVGLIQKGSGALIAVSTSGRAFVDP